MSDRYKPYREAALAVAIEAGGVLSRAFGTVTAREKAPFDLVTDADLASQRLILDRLRSMFPNQTIQAEEEGLVADPENPWRWVVDPLDGTVNFAHGLPIWGVSIGLAHEGDVVAGVVHCPLMGQTFAASRGWGATLNGKSIHVSATDRLERSLIAAALPTSLGDSADREMAWFRRFSTGTHSVRRSGSTAWNLAMLAAGGFEVCYGSRIMAWDAAAGICLVKEAGGLVTTMTGDPYNLDGLSMLATNGRLHDEALTAIAEATGRAGV